MLKITVVAILLALNAYIFLKARGTRNSFPEAYTWIGRDFPHQLPMARELEMVHMITEETAFYPLGVAGEDAWASVLPASGPYCRLGPRRRLFAVTMFHELHCLQIFNYGFGRGMEQGHVVHCLTYLRHGALCSADLTLEPGDFANRNFTRDRSGSEHQCHDWSQIYGMYDKNWSAWKAAATAEADS